MIQRRTRSRRTLQHRWIGRIRGAALFQQAPLIRAFLRYRKGPCDFRHNSPLSRPRLCQPRSRVTLDLWSQDLGLGASEQVSSRTEETKERCPNVVTSTCGLTFPLPLAPGYELGGDERGAIGAVAETLTPVPGLFQSILTQASREATHDSDRAAGQTVDVVPDGTGQMAEGVASQQSLQSWSLEPVEKRTVSDFLPTNPLALSGEVLPMLRLGMHDVEMGRPGGENGLLRVSRQSPAELVFRLMSPPPLRRAAGGERTPRGRLRFVSCRKWITRDDPGMPPPEPAAILCRMTFRRP
jgi:hypothetical protein